MSIQSIEYLESYAWLGSKLGLDRIKELLNRMDNPQKGLRFIHLAGTNGKGSTAAFLAAMFQEAGYRTGLYTSPYIHTFYERMQINGLAISSDELDQIVGDMRIHADAMEDHPTTFELDTAVAFSFFAQRQCDIVILETGMGGGLDATNAIENPELCVITPIDMDHMEYLGDTISKIATAKAGILKPGRPVVSATQKPQALTVLQEVAGKLGASFTQVDTGAITVLGHNLYGQDFSLGEKQYHINLLGNYQVENAALALLTAEKINEQGRFHLSETAITEGLKKARWPGRFELCATNPPAIVDGGHNAQGAVALSQSLKRYFPDTPITFVMGVMADKDVAAILNPVLPLATKFYTVTPSTPRAMGAEKLATLIEEMGGQAEAVEAGMEAAFSLAKADALAQGGIVCYFGSLYSVGNARDAIGLGQGKYYLAEKDEVVTGQGA